MRARGLLVAMSLGTGLVVGPVALAAGPYPPPSEVSGSVDPNRIKAGECTTFSGRGFKARTDIAVADDGAPRGTTRTDDAGTFRMELCYPTDARAGEHTITGTGEIPDAGTSPTALSRFLLPSASAAEVRTVSAKLIVTGVAQSDPGGGTGGGSTGGGSTGGAASPTGGGGSLQDPPSDRGDAGVILAGGGTTAVSGPDGAGTVTNPTRVVALPRTGIGALLLALIGTGLVAVGSAALLLTERRHRRRRRSGSGTPATA